MHVIRTTLSFVIHWCHAPACLLDNMIKSAIHCILSNALCFIILYGFAIIETPPMDPKQNKWWDHIWDTSFQQLMWTTQSIVQGLTNYVESLHTRARTHHAIPLHRARTHMNALAHTLAYTAIMVMATHQPYHASESMAFDTDSRLVGIDNQCSACITHVHEDMPGELVPCHHSIKGFGGSKLWNVWHGMIKWSIEDDEGITHTLVIPNSYYVHSQKCIY